MLENPCCCILEIINKKGLHARAAAKFVKTVAAFQADAWIRLGDSRVCGTSIMGLLMLSASQSTFLEITTSGSDAVPLMNALRDLIQQKFHEET